MRLECKTCGKYIVYSPEDIVSAYTGEHQSNLDFIRCDNCDEYVLLVDGKNNFR